MRDHPLNLSACTCIVKLNKCSNINCTLWYVHRFPLLSNLASCFSNWHLELFTPTPPFKRSQSVFLCEARFTFHWRAFSVLHFILSLSFTCFGISTFGWTSMSLLTNLLSRHQFQACSWLSSRVFKAASHALHSHLVQLVIISHTYLLQLKSFDY